MLAACDKAGNSSLFIELSLLSIQESLERFLREVRPDPMTAQMRLTTARHAFATAQFSRKDYLVHFPGLSTATASRDLRGGVDPKILVRAGDKSLARYRFR